MPEILEFEPAPKRKLRIGIDIDNTIADSYPQVIKEFNTAFKTNVIYSDVFDYYHLENHTTADKKEVEIFIDGLERNREFLLSLPVYEEAGSVLKRWAREGYRVHYITARPPHSKRSTVSWLEKHNLYIPGSVIDLHDETREESSAEFKARIVREKKIDVMIEDNKEIAEAMTIPVLLIGHPWNQGKLKPNISRVRDWKEVESWVKRYERSKTV